MEVSISSRASEYRRSLDKATELKARKMRCSCGYRSCENVLAADTFSRIDFHDPRRANSCKDLISSVIVSSLTVAGGGGSEDSIREGYLEERAVKGKSK